MGWMMFHMLGGPPTLPAEVAAALPTRSIPHGMNGLFHGDSGFNWHSASIAAGLARTFGWRMT